MTVAGRGAGADVFQGIVANFVNENSSTTNIGTDLQVRSKQEHGDGKKEIRTGCGTVDEVQGRTVGGRLDSRRAA